MFEKPVKSWQVLAVNRSVQVWLVLCGKARGAVEVEEGAKMVAPRGVDLDQTSAQLQWEEDALPVR